MDSKQLETLVANSPDAPGNIEIEYPNVEVISKRQSLMESYNKLKSELEPETVLTTKHEIYSSTDGNQKHYLDIIMRDNNSERKAKITYEINSDI